MVNVCFCCVFPRDWVGETSPKWPVLCRVGCKTLTQSISRVVGYRWHCVLLVSDVMMSMIRGCCDDPVGGGSDLTGTCMVPTSADEPPAKLESSYTFTTECFFMAHHTLSLGFRVLHERLVQLNRELHRIQEVYRDVSQHAAADTEPAQRLKDDMERSQSCALCADPKQGNPESYPLIASAKEDM